MNDYTTINRQAAIDAICEVCYIRRQAAIDASCTCHGGVHCNHYPCKDVQAIMDLPSAQSERKKGQWIKKMQITETTKYSSYNPRWYCSCCQTEYDPAIANEINFCWKCGAEMVKGEEDD